MVVINKKIFLISFLSALLVISGGFLIYMSFNKKDKTISLTVATLPPITKNITSTAPINTTNNSTELSAKETYLRMNTEFSTIEDANDLEDLTKKYGSKNTIAQYEADKKIMQSKPNGEIIANQILQLAKTVSPTPAQIKNIREEIGTDNITTVLYITSDNPTNKNGVVKMVKENGLWKLESEKWNAK